MKNYLKIAEETAKLVESKQEAYGDSFGKSADIIKVLYPDGIKVEQYQDVLTLVRIIDKMFRIATKKDAFGESPYKDILGYALLAAEKEEAAKTAPVVFKNGNGVTFTSGYYDSKGAWSDYSATTPAQSYAEALKAARAEALKVPSPDPGKDKK